MLLLSAGVGRRSLRRATIVGIAYGLFTLACITFVYSPSRWADKDIEEDLHKEHEDANDTRSRVAGESLAAQVVVSFWSYSNLVFYLAAWLTPTERWNRRPAAIYWCRFIALYRLAQTIALALISLEVRT